MDEAGGVHGVDRLGRLANEPQAVAFQHRDAAGQQGIQVGAFQVLHHQVGHALGGDAEFIGLDDPRVLQLDRRFRPPTVCRAP